MKIKLTMTSLVLAVSLGSHLHAEVPHQFVAGEAAVAAEVNQNFQYLDGRIDTAISEAETAETTLANDIASNTADIATVEDGVIANTTDLGAIDTRVTNLETATAASCSLLGEHEEDISSQLSYDGESGESWIWDSDLEIDVSGLGGGYYDDGIDHTTFIPAHWGLFYNPVNNATVPYIGPMKVVSVVDDKDNCFNSTFLIDGYPAMVVAKTDVYSDEYSEVTSTDGYDHQLDVYRAWIVKKYLAYVLIKANDTVVKLKVGLEPPITTYYEEEDEKLSQAVAYKYVVNQVNLVRTDVVNTNASFIQKVDDIIDYFHIGSDVDISSYGFDSYTITTVNTGG